MFFGRAIAFVVLAFACTSHASEKIEFVRLVGHRKSCDAATGERQLHVDLEVNVKAPGKYYLYLGFGRPGSFTGFISDLQLTNGSHVVRGVAYGDRIYRDQIEPSTFRAALGTRVNSRGHDEDSLAEPLPYDWKEFKRAVAVVDPSAKPEDVVRTIGRTLMLDHHRDIVFDKWHLQKERAELAKLSEWFKTEPRSKTHELWQHLLPLAGQGASYIALAKDRTAAFAIIDRESFNKFVETLDGFRMRNADTGLQQAAFYMAACENEHPLRYKVLRSLPQDKVKEKTAPQYRSIQGWFEANPNQAFFEPELRATGDVVELNFFAWHGYRGRLFLHRFSMDKNGKVATHGMQNVAREVGQWYLE